MSRQSSPHHMVNFSGALIAACSGACLGLGYSCLFDPEFGKGDSLALVKRKTAGASAFVLGAYLWCRAFLRVAWLTVPKPADWNCAAGSKNKGRLRDESLSRVNSHIKNRYSSLVDIHNSTIVTTPTSPRLSLLVLSTLRTHSLFGGMHGRGNCCCTASSQL